MSGAATPEMQAALDAAGADYGDMRAVAAEARCHQSTLHHYLRGHGCSAAMEWRIRNAALTLGVSLPWPRLKRKRAAQAVERGTALGVG